MGFVGSIVGGILGSNAAGNATSAEVTGATTAQNLEKQNQTNAQDFQTGVWTGTQQNEQPYQSLGSTSANALAARLQKGFTAPTLSEAEQTPGYQFNLEQGTQAIDENAAANGTLMTGNTGVALQKFGQGLASTTYQQAYQNALDSYLANVNPLQQATNTGLASTGQEGQLGQEASGNMAQIDLTGADQQAKQINNAAAARASGYLAQGKAMSDIVGGVAGGVGNMDFSGGSSPLEMIGQFAGA